MIEEKHEWVHAHIDPNDLTGDPEYIEEIRQYVSEHPERLDPETGMFDFGLMEKTYVTIKLVDN